MKFNKKNLISMVITLVIITALLISGPVSAFEVRLIGEFSNETPNQGEVIYIEAEIDIESQERIFVYLAHLNINERRCSFYAENGSAYNESGCEGITVTPLSPIESTQGYGYDFMPDYGYGYGYGYPREYGYGYNFGYSNTILRYNISIDTTGFAPGPYNTELVVNLGTVEEQIIFKSEQKSFTVLGDAPNVSVISLGQDTGIEGPNTWAPVVDWNSSTNCIYSYDNFTTNVTVDCLEGGSDINATSGDGVNTLYVAGSYDFSNLGVDAEGFVWDETKPQIQTMHVDIDPVANVHVGSQLNLTVVFDEPMNTSENPMISAPGIMSHTGSGASWNSDNQTFIYHWIIDDSSIERDINVTVSNAQDLAGNVMDAHLNESMFSIDTIPPETTLTATLTDNSEYDNNTWTNQNITVEFNCADDGSGCFEIYTWFNEHPFNGTSPINRTINETGRYNITFFSVDNAGNVEDTKNFIVKKAASGPPGIGGDWEFPENTTPDNTTNVTVHQTFNTTIDMGDGNLTTITLQNGTVITATDGGNLNFSAFGLVNASLDALAGFDANIIAEGGVIKFGIPNLGITFNPAVNVKLYVGNEHNGTTFDIRRSLNETWNWTQEGITPKTCTVVAGICEFNITQASYFATTSTATPTPTPTTSRWKWWIDDEVEEEIETEIEEPEEEPEEPEEEEEEIPVEPPVDEVEEKLDVGAFVWGGILVVVIVALVLVVLSRVKKSPKKPVTKKTTKK